MKKIAFVIASLLVIHIGLLIYDAGLFVSIDSKTEYSCIEIEGAIGAEDMALVGDKLFISSTRLPFRWNFDKGDLLLLDLNKTDPELKSLASEFNLSPHGIYAAEFEGQTRLWVVNHGQSNDSVEVFDWDGETLTKKDSIKLSEPNANDVVAVNLNQFYVTHDHGSTSDFGKLLENYTRLGQGSITYYNGADEPYTVESGLSFANGIEHINGRLYVAQMLGKKISVFDITSDGVDKIDQIELKYLPDNISLDQKGSLIVGSHPRAFDLKSHAFDESEIAPSFISRIDLKSKKEELLFQDTGEFYSAASVGIVNGNELFIGNIYGKSILRCQR